MDQVMAFLTYYESWAEQLVTADSACLYIALVAEQDLLDEHSRAELKRAVHGWREGFADLLRPVFPEDCGVEVEELADQLFATFEGAYMLCRVQESGDPMRRQLRVFRQLVEHLLRASH